MKTSDSLRTKSIVIPAQAGTLQRLRSPKITNHRTAAPPAVIPAQAGILQSRYRLKILVCAAVRRIGMTLLPLVFTATANAFEIGGHTKLRVTSVALPDDSLLADFSDDPVNDAGAELRLKLRQDAGGWRAFADYQLLALGGDRFELRRQNPALEFGTAALPEDDRRLFDLTHVISEDDDRATAHRLDRFYVSHTTDKTVVNLGRQAVSWGNGLIYNPLDFFNPFDPAAIDTEYKTGDDMLYAQYLFDSGDDLQAVWVGRRDEDDEVEREVASLALKFHGFAGAGEYDLLLAEHFDDVIAGFGGAADIGEAVWRGDLVFTDSDEDDHTSLVLNWSYSWTWGQRNWNATLEYYRNGFGIDDGDYGPAALAQNPDLVERIRRGELFTLGENNLGGNAAVELTPLWLLTTSLFANLDDDSFLLQLLSQHDLQQDLSLLLALNLPSGENGSEFGGIDSGIDGPNLGVDTSLFAQLAWYF